ncbi:MAG TPA: FAD-binding oxidoreductase [Isosphaeraceae bacterium]|nr:FAD-binding oxidoreductase [Isosphaeraceae bacterium]
MNWPDSAAEGVLGDGRFASATDRPRDTDALRQAITERISAGYALYPQGGRTALDYGGIPRQPGVAIDTTALDQVIDYPFADMTITLQAGMTLAALQTVLAEHNQRLPLDAPCPDRATLGGIYATNTSGPRRFGAGRPRDQIIGVSFATSAGDVVKGGGRVVKNVAGYDLPKLLTGSMGTLGIITQLTLKIRPRPEASALAWAVFERADDVAQALSALNTSDTRPIAMELLNRSGARLVGEPLALPLGEWVLAIGFEDNATAVTWQLERLRQELSIAQVTFVEGEAASSLWSALTAFPTRECGPVGFTANLRLSSVVPFVNSLDPGRWAVQAHAGNGIVRALSLGETPLEELPTEIATLRRQAVDDGGNLILPRCPTDWKARLRVWGEPRGDWPLAERVKHTLDPLGVLNPGRFVGSI